MPAFRLLLLAVFAFALLLAGCPGKGKQQHAGTASGGGDESGGAAASTALKVQLVLSDLGLSDGYFARQSDSQLKALAAAGSIQYVPLGKVPEAIKDEPGSDDVGLPPGAFGIESKNPVRQPGSMTQAEAEAVLDGAADCDLLVLSAPSLVQPALDRISSGKFKTEALILLDQDGWAGLSGKPVVPVYSLHYDVTPVAFVAGVAAAASSNTSMFMALASKNDPDADAWLDGAFAGARFRANGAQMLVKKLESGPDGMVTPDSFLAAYEQLKAAGGPAFQCNHFLVCLGRSTPTIMLVLSKKPTNGYCLGGWADFTSVRPSRFVGCALKKPDMALAHIFGHIQEPADLDKLAAWGEASAAAPSADSAAAEVRPDFGRVISVGLDEGAVGFTDLKDYSNFNPDGDDISEAVTQAIEEIKSGELDYAALIKESKEQH